MNQQSDQKTKEFKNVRVVLVGFMGAGKTTLAQNLAEKLNCTFFDLDEFIEARENRTIAQIIEQLGEPVFRELETEALREILRIDNSCVAALGGGTWTIEENRKLIEQRSGLSIWLDAPFETCWRRILKSTTVLRPLARTKKQARELFEARQTVYQTAQIHIKIKPRQSINKLAEEVYSQIVENAAQGK